MDGICQIYSGSAMYCQSDRHSAVCGSWCDQPHCGAGASTTFLCRDGSVRTPDKDGIVPNLLAAEIAALTGKDAGEQYQALTTVFGTPYYTGIDMPATPEQKARLAKLSSVAIKESELAGVPITVTVTNAPGNIAPIGGIKVVAAIGWFAARPSCTEDIYKIYAESIRDQTHLESIVTESQVILNNALQASDPGHV
jgi:phosphoglucomutase